MEDTRTAYFQAHELCKLRRRHDRREGHPDYSRCNHPYLSAIRATRQSRSRRYFARCAERVRIAGTGKLRTIFLSRYVQWRHLPSTYVFVIRQMRVHARACSINKETHSWLNKSHLCINPVLSLAFLACSLAAVACAMTTTHAKCWKSSPLALSRHLHRKTNQMRTLHNR